MRGTAALVSPGKAGRVLWRRRRRAQRQLLGAGFQPLGSREEQANVMAVIGLGREVPKFFGQVQ